MGLTSTYRQVSRPFPDLLHLGLLSGRGFFRPVVGLSWVPCRTGWDPSSTPAFPVDVNPSGTTPGSDPGSDEKEMRRVVTTDPPQEHGEMSVFVTPSLSLSPSRSECVDPLPTSPPNLGPVRLRVQVTRSDDQDPGLKPPAEGDGYVGGGRPDKLQETLSESSSDYYNGNR